MTAGMLRGGALYLRLVIGLALVLAAPGCGKDDPRVGSRKAPLPTSFGNYLYKAGSWVELAEQKQCVGKPQILIFDRRLASPELTPERALQWRPVARITRRVEEWTDTFGTRCYRTKEVDTSQVIGESLALDARPVPDRSDMIIVEPKEPLPRGPNEVRVLGSTHQLECTEGDGQPVERHRWVRLGRRHRSTGGTLRPPSDYDDLRKTLAETVDAAVTKRSTDALSAAVRQVREFDQDMYARAKTALRESLSAHIRSTRTIKQALTAHAAALKLEPDLKDTLAADVKHVAEPIVKDALANERFAVAMGMCQDLSRAGVHLSLLHADAQSGLNRIHKADRDALAALRADFDQRGELIGRTVALVERASTRAAGTVRVTDRHLEWFDRKKQQRRVWLGDIIQLDRRSASPMFGGATTYGIDVETTSKTRAGVRDPTLHFATPAEAAEVLRTLDKACRDWRSRHEERRVVKFTAYPPYPSRIVHFGDGRGSWRTVPTSAPMSVIDANDRTYKRQPGRSMRVPHTPSIRFVASEGPLQVTVERYPYNGIKAGGKEAERWERVIKDQEAKAEGRAQLEAWARKREEVWLAEVGLTREEMLALCSSYHANEGGWGGTYRLSKIEHFRFVNVGEVEFTAHVAYRYEPTSGGKRGGHHGGTDQRTFGFKKTGGRWRVVEWGGNKSARFPKRDALQRRADPATRKKMIDRAKLLASKKAFVIDPHGERSVETGFFLVPKSLDDEGFVITGTLYDLGQLPPIKLGCAIEVMGPDRFTLTDEQRRSADFHIDRRGRMHGSPSWVPQRGRFQQGMAMQVASKETIQRLPAVLEFFERCAELAKSPQPAHTVRLMHGNASMDAAEAVSRIKTEQELIGVRAGRPEAVADGNVVSYNTIKRGVVIRYPKIPTARRVWVCLYEDRPQRNPSGGAAPVTVRINGSKRVPLRPEPRARGDRGVRSWVAIIEFATPAPVFEIAVHGAEQTSRLGLTEVLLEE